MENIVIFPNHSNPISPYLESEILKNFPNSKIVSPDDLDRIDPSQNLILVSAYGRTPNMDEAIIPHYISTVARASDYNTIYITDNNLEDIISNIKTSIQTGKGNRKTSVAAIDNIFYPQHTSGKRIIDLNLLDFYHSTEIRSSSPYEIDLTGRSRLILSLSQLTLPKGEWAINIMYDLDEPAVHHRLQFEWGSLHAFDTHCPEIDRSGRFETKLNCRLDSVEQVELRVALMTPAFSGRIIINEVYLERTV